MATFPNTVDPAATNNVLPPEQPGWVHMGGKAIDPATMYVGVTADYRVFSGQSGYNANAANNGAVGTTVYYRLSDFINYIVATAKGQ